MKQCTYCKKEFFNDEEFNADQIRHEKIIKKAMALWGNQGNPIHYILKSGGQVGPSTPTELPDRCTWYSKEHKLEDHTYHNNVGHSLCVVRCKRCKCERKFNKEEMDKYNRKHGTW